MPLKQAPGVAQRSVRGKDHVRQTWCWQPLSSYSNRGHIVCWKRERHLLQGGAGVVSGTTVNVTAARHHGPSGTVRAAAFVGLVVGLSGRVFLAQTAPLRCLM